MPTSTAHRVSGFAGCNEFSALYRAGGRTLIVTNPSITMAACDEATMAFEQAYMSLLDQSRFYTVRRDTLTIYDGDRNTILRFDAAPANPLLGKWLVDSFETAPGTVSALDRGHRDRRRVPDRLARRLRGLQLVQRRLRHERDGRPGQQARD